MKKSKIERYVTVDAFINGKSVLASVLCGLEIGDKVICTQDVIRYDNIEFKVGYVYEVSKLSNVGGAMAKGIYSEENRLLVSDSFEILTMK